MFDNHIQYYAYANRIDDKTFVGLLMNKSFWLKTINKTNNKKFTIEDWDELRPRADLKGAALAEIEPMGDKKLVTWFIGDNEFCVIVDAEKNLQWQCNPTNLKSFPQWLNPLIEKI